MRIATFNLWHGLSPSNVVAFEALEPNGRRDLRQQLQVEVLKSLEADCYCLQEVNPVRERGLELGGLLGCSVNVQPDLTGIKILGYGPPFNLASGLAVLGVAPMKMVCSEQLSGPRTGFATRFLSWQLKESRYALFSELNSEQFGRTLLVNAHLHHGLEADENLITEMKKVCKQMDLHGVVQEDLLERLMAGNVRREQEINVLLGALDKLLSRYEIVIVCGDFNSVPGSGVYKRMVETGFSDCWLEAHPNDPGFTFDAEQNSANHILQERFPPSVVIEDLTFSAEAKKALGDLLGKQETRRRRIDYIWMRSKSGSVRVKSASLFGRPNAEGLAPSDHFGLVVELN